MKKIWILVAILVLAGVGVGAYVVLSGEDDDSETNTSQSQQEAGGSTGGEFNPVPTDDLEYVATLSGDAEGGRYEAIIESDGDGNTKFSGESNGETFEMYALEDGSSIMCNAGTCYKFTSGGAETPVSSEQYEYTDEDFESYRNNAQYKGQVSCPAGTCALWEYSENGTVVKMYLASNGRVSRVTSSGPDGDFEITYDYKNVSITPPSNVQTL